MSNTGVRRSGRTPVKRSFLEESETLSNSDESAALTSDDEWEPVDDEEELVVPHGVGDDEFDGPTEDPLGFDYDRPPYNNPTEMHGASSNTVRINVVIKDEVDLSQSTSPEERKRISKGADINVNQRDGSDNNNGLRNIPEERKQRRLELQRIRRRRKITEEQRKRASELQRRRRHQRSEEQRRQASERERLRRKNLTEEQRKRKAEQQRIKRMNRNEEQRQRDHEKKNLRRKKKTDEMKKTQDELKKQLDQDLTEEERKEVTDKLEQIEEDIFQRNMKGYLSRHARLAMMTEEEIKKERRMYTVRKHSKMMNETPEEREERLKKSRQRYKEARKHWTPEQHERHREWVRNNLKMKAQMQPYSEFTEEKKERIRAYQRERLKQETPEQREQRLARYKRNMEKRRLLNKMQEEGVSKEAAEAELKISRPDLYPAPNDNSVQGSKPFKPYRPRDPNKQKPPPGRKSTVTAAELAELKLMEHRGRKVGKRRSRLPQTEENSNATDGGDTMVPPCDISALSSASEPIIDAPNGSTFATIDTTEKIETKSSPCNTSSHLVSVKQHDIAAQVIVKEEHTITNISTEKQTPSASVSDGNSQSQLSLFNECPTANENFDPTENRTEKDVTIDKSCLNGTFEPIEDYVSSLLGIPLGVEYSDSENCDHAADSTDENCAVEGEVEQKLEKNTSPSSSTVGKEEPNNDDVIDSSTTQESSQKEVVKLTCDKCGRTYTNKKYFMLHLESHENMKSFKCPHPSCDKEFSHSSYVLRHFLKTHEDNKNADSQQPRIDTEERVRRKVPSPSICPYCGKLFQADSQLARHVRSLHSSFNRKEDGFMCHHCKKVFKVKCTLDDHIRRAHLGMDHKCDLCGRCFQSATKLWKHKVDRHDMKDLDPSSVSSKIKMVICEYCGVKIFRGMKLHIEKEHPEHLEKYVNEQEGKDRREEKRQYWHTIGKFKKKEWLLSRGKQANLQQPSPSNQVKPPAGISCAICNRTFTRPDSWRKHMEKIHPSDTSISCDKCNLIRATETDLVKHILNRHPGLAKIKIHGIIVDSNSNKEGQVDKKEKQILCQFCKSPYEDRFLYRMHLYEKHCKDIIQSFKEGIAEEQEKPAFPCPHCDTIIRTNETGLTIHIGKAHPDQCCAKVKSRRKEQDTTTRQSRKKRAPRKANNVQRKVSGTLLESSDDDGNGSDEDLHNNTNVHPSRKSLRTKCPTRRYIDNKLSENILNREKRQARLTEQKKVVVPSSPMKFTKFEKKLLEKYPSVKWKGNPAVVLERLILIKTEVL